MFYEELTPSHDGYRVVRILPEHFDALCGAIRLDLSEICYGKDMVGLGLEFQTYKNTCRAISDMLNAMDERKKIGFIGELIMHLIVPEVFGSQIESLSMLLSTSDRNIKRGFDLNYYQCNNSAIWYGEVKSGINRERKELMRRSEKGLDNYFTGLSKTGSKNTQSRWNNAIHEMASIFCSRQEQLKNLASILDKSRADILKGTSRNALVMVVNFGDPDTDFQNVNDIEEELKRIESNNTFDECLIISVRRETFLDILKFLTQEGSMQ